MLYRKVYGTTKKVGECENKDWIPKGVENGKLLDEIAKKAETSSKKSTQELGTAIQGCESFKISENGDTSINLCIKGNEDGQISNYLIKRSIDSRIYDDVSRLAYQQRINNALRLARDHQISLRETDDLMPNRAHLPLPTSEQALRPPQRGISRPTLARDHKISLRETDDPRPQYSLYVPPAEKAEPDLDF